MKTAFEKLKKISADYCAAVDELAEEYDLDGRRDYLYNDEIKAQRVSERNTDYNARVDALAKKAQEGASLEIAKLREAVQAYITTSTDPTTLATSGRPWGQAPAVGSVIMQGMIDKLPAKLDEMVERWNALAG